VKVLGCSADPRASTIPPPPTSAARHLGEQLVGFSERLVKLVNATTLDVVDVDNFMALANARSAARAFYDQLLAAEAEIERLKGELAAARDVHETAR
jgi:hypothetical protein